MKFNATAAASTTTTLKYANATRCPNDDVDDIKIHKYDKWNDEIEKKNIYIK